MIGGPHSISGRTVEAPPEGSQFAEGPKRPGLLVPAPLVPSPMPKEDSFQRSETDEKAAAAVSRLKDLNSGIVGTIRRFWNWLRNRDTDFGRMREAERSALMSVADLYSPNHRELRPEELKHLSKTQRKLHEGYYAALRNPVPHSVALHQEDFPEIASKNLTEQSAQLMSEAQNLVKYLRNPEGGTADLDAADVRRTELEHHLKELQKAAARSGGPAENRALSQNIAIIEKILGEAEKTILDKPSVAPLSPEDAKRQEAIQAAREQVEFEMLPEKAGSVPPSIQAILGQTGPSSDPVGDLRRLDAFLKVASNSRENGENPIEEPSVAEVDASNRYRQISKSLTEANRAEMTQDELEALQMQEQMANVSDSPSHVGQRPAGSHGLLDVQASPVDSELLARFNALRKNNDSPGQRVPAYSPSASGDIPDLEQLKFEDDIKKAIGAGSKKEAMQQLNDLRKQIEIGPKSNQQASRILQLQRAGRIAERKPY